MKENSIEVFFHCKKCIAERPEGTSPRDYARFECGFTKKGIQIWCTRHDVNVLHVDFQGTKHPAVM